MATAEAAEEAVEEDTEDNRSDLSAPLAEDGSERDYGDVFEPRTINRNMMYRHRPQPTGAISINAT